MAGTAGSGGNVRSDGVGQLALLPDPKTEPTSASPRPYLSFSQLVAYQDCPQKAKLKYVDRVATQPQGAFIGGKIVHSTIEESERQGWWEDQDNFAAEGAGALYFHHSLEKAISEAGGPEAIRWGGRKSRDFPNGEDGRWWHLTGETMLRRYSATRRVDLAGISVLPGGIEMEVFFTLPTSGMPVKGYIDALLAADTNGEPILLDWKTGTWASSPFQLAGYAVMLKRAGYDVQRGVMVYLRRNESDRRMHWVNLAPLLPFVEPGYEAMLKRYETGVWEPRIDAWHESCAVREHCSYYKALKETEVT